MELYWLWLQTKSKLTVKAQLRLLATFGTPEEIWLASAAELKAACKLGRGALEELLDHDLTEAKQIQLACSEKNIHILTLDDPAYPELLKQIPDPPLVLYYVGTLPAFDEELPITVVGHRHPSNNGWNAAYRLGTELSKSGVIVVSGAAIGIDAAAMEGALRGGSPVVAVVGGGVDVIYPRENRRLLEGARDYGCVISEYPPGTRPYGWHFPIRNRILSGLSRGTIVVEAPRRSGSLSTARHALEQGRDVFAVPGSAGDPLCAGSNDLLRQGAGYAEYANDVIGEYLHIFRDRIHLLSEEETKSYLEAQREFFDKKEVLFVASPVEIPSAAPQKEVDKPNLQTYIDLQETPEGLSPGEGAVFRALMAGAERTDELIDRTNLCAADVLCALTMLEIYGYIRSEAGGRFTLCLKG